MLDEHQLYEFWALQKEEKASGEMPFLLRLHLERARGRRASDAAALHQERSLACHGQAQALASSWSPRA